MNTFRCAIAFGVVIVGVASPLSRAAAQNQCPIASPLSVEVAQNSTVSFQLVASDPDVGDVLGYIIIVPAAHGNVTLNGQTGAGIYAPNPDYCGADGFLYAANDGQCVSPSAIVAVTVCPPSNSDSDGDHVPNAQDNCPETPAGAVVNAQGCAIVQLCPCESTWEGHGAYVQCVTRAAEDFVAGGLITDLEKEAIVSTAARSSCGHK